MAEYHEEREGNTSSDPQISKRGPTLKQAVKRNSYNKLTQCLIFNRKGCLTVLGLLCLKSQHDEIYVCGCVNECTIILCVWSMFVLKWGALKLLKKLKCWWKSWIDKSWMIWSWKKVYFDWVKKCVNGCELKTKLNFRFEERIRLCF